MLHVSFGDKKMKYLKKNRLVTDVLLFYVNRRKEETNATSFLSQQTSRDKIQLLTESLFAHTMLLIFDSDRARAKDTLAVAQRSGEQLKCRNDFVLCSDTAYAKNKQHTFLSEFRNAHTCVWYCVSFAAFVADGSKTARSVCSRCIARMERAQKIKNRLDREIAFRRMKQFSE